jgi:hypothetical protein
LLNNQGVRQMVLAFIPEATDGVDRAMDALSSSDEMPADVYFVINDDEYLINAVNLIWTKKIPIGFKKMKQILRLRSKE